MTEGQRIVRLVLAGTIALGAWPARAAAQRNAVLSGQVIDEQASVPVAAAAVTLRALDVRGRPVRHSTTARDGEYRFADLEQGRYEVVIEGFGYRRARFRVTLERDAPLYVSILIEPDPFVLDAMGPAYRRPEGPLLIVPPAAQRTGALERRAESVRARQRHFLSSDVRQLSSADLRESNTLIEDDIFRALQRLPGVGTRDDFAADLWTRGSPASQTVVLFDGMPIVGGFHALGIMGGLDPDGLRSATFQPGVPAASLQGGGAGVIEVASRSGAEFEARRTAALSPASARLSASGRLSSRIGWVVAGRRSYLDAARLVDGSSLPGSGPVPYAFGDITARVDASISHRIRLEASSFWQNDRLFGNVTDLAYGNAGSWGTHVARGTLVVGLGGLTLRQTVGVTGFDASVRTIPSRTGIHSPVHPDTENHYHTIIWESRIDASPLSSEPWSIGLRASRENQDYRGPAIDPARLLEPDQILAHGRLDLLPIIEDYERASMLSSASMTRVALWADRRKRITRALDIEGGLRIETGDRAGEHRTRFAPRVVARYSRPGSRLTMSAGYGRSYQYTQSTANTDVLRSGLRASELLAQASPDVPALRSDLFTVGGEIWADFNWLFGATAWMRASDGVMLPDPAPGRLDAPLPVVAANGMGGGIELSARRIEGRVRGFANLTLSRFRLRADSIEFNASEDRTLMTNIGVVIDIVPSLTVGAMGRGQTGAPFTRLTLVNTGCAESAPCPAASPPLAGSPNAQRTPGTVVFDLMAEWMHAFNGWSFSIYGQIHNVLGSTNAATYHWSCICTATPDGGGLYDNFDRGLPRLPVIGLRVRF